MFLGTGFIIEDGTVLVTADHNIRGFIDTPLYFTTATDVTTFWELEVIDRDPLHDLALLAVDAGYAPQMPRLTVLGEDFEPATDQQVQTTEYGHTEEVDGRLKLRPATRIGNVTRVIDATENLSGPAGVDALEISFPALRGASGAPVFYSFYRPGQVVGVIVANASYDLLPIQIETDLTDDNTLLEERKYLLPQALAVNIKHLLPMYNRHLKGQS